MWHGSFPTINPCQSSIRRIWSAQKDIELEIADILFIDSALLLQSSLSSNAIACTMLCGQMRRRLALRKDCCHA